PARRDDVPSHGAFPFLDEARAAQRDHAARAIRRDRRGARGRARRRRGRSRARDLEPRLDHRGRGRDEADQVARHRRPPRAYRRHPDPLGLHRPRQARLPREYADAVRRRRERADAGVQVVPRARGEGVMALESQDIVRRSATTTKPPQVRRARTAPVAKLIDTSQCIGCKACRVACMEWNDLRDEIGTCSGVYDNPLDLTEHSWTVMRFAEHENERGDLEWLIRKDGCMHCAEPGCLAACPPPGAIVQYANGIVDFDSEHCIGYGYCITGCPFNTPRLSGVDGKAYNCTLCSDRVAAGREPACVKACPTGALVFGTKEDMLRHAEERVEDLKSRGFENAG